MEYNEYKELMMDYVSDKLSANKQLEFEQFIADNPKYNQEVAELKSTWTKVDTLEIPEPSAKMDAQFYATLKAEKEKRLLTGVSIFEKIQSYFSFPTYKQLAYSLAVLFIGLFVGYQFNFKKDIAPQNTEIANTETEKVRSQLVLALLDQPSANKRLQGVNEANKLDNVTESVIAVLFKTLNNDENVNVRLAAVESLSNYVDNPMVREGLVKSIVAQESPLVQIALADLMVLIQEKKSIDPMEELLQQPDINATAKQKLKESIQHLI